MAKTFREALNGHRVMVARHREEKAVLEHEYRVAVIAAFRAKYPRRKLVRNFSFAAPPIWGKLAAIDEELMREVRALFTERAEGMTTDHKAAREASEEEVNLAAEGYIPHPEEWGRWTLLATTYSGTYSSQGFGAMKYAHEAAERKAEDARGHGVGARVEKKARKAEGRWGIEHGEFLVWVDTDELGAEALRRKPGIPLREWVRRCWARGVNPRVMSPFLPVGYEEKVGLDFFGGEFREVGVECRALVPVG
jgi:hypothetical protein